MRGRGQAFFGPGVAQANENGFHAFVVCLLGCAQHKANNGNDQTDNKQINTHRSAI
jgi:hypothetical protein